MLCNDNHRACGTILAVVQFGSGSAVPGENLDPDLGFGPGGTIGRAFLPQSSRRFFILGGRIAYHSMEEKKFNVSHRTFASSLGVLII